MRRVLPVWVTVPTVEREEVPLVVACWPSATAGGSPVMLRTCGSTAAWMRRRAKGATVSK